MWRNAVSSEPGIKAALLITPPTGDERHSPGVSQLQAPRFAHKYWFTTHRGLVANENDHTRRTVGQCVKAARLKESVKVLLSLSVSAQRYIASIPGCRFVFFLLFFFYGRWVISFIYHRLFSPSHGSLLNHCLIFAIKCRRSPMCERASGSIDLPIHLT